MHIKKEFLKGLDKQLKKKVYSLLNFAHRINNVRYNDDNLLHIIRFVIYNRRFDRIESLYKTLHKYFNLSNSELKYANYDFCYNMNKNTLEELEERWLGLTYIQKLLVIEKYYPESEVLKYSYKIPELIKIYKPNEYSYFGYIVPKYNYSCNIGVDDILNIKGDKIILKNKENTKAYSPFLLRD